jgi:hypothetical protein
MWLRSETDVGIQLALSGWNGMARALMVAFQRDTDKIAARHFGRSCATFWPFLRDMRATCATPVFATRYVVYVARMSRA